MNVIYFLLLLFFTLTAKSDAQPTSPKSSMRLDAFIDIPDELDGCICKLFFSDDIEKKRNHILLSGVNSRGDNVIFISINKKIEKLRLIKMNKNQRIEVYENNFYKVFLIYTNKEQSGYESFNLEGYIKLLDKNKNMLKVRFIGYCGC